MDNALAFLFYLDCRLIPSKIPILNSFCSSLHCFELQKALLFLVPVTHCGLWPCYGNLGVFIVCVFYHNHICRKRGFRTPPGCAWACVRVRITALRYAMVEDVSVNISRSLVKQERSEVRKGRQSAYHSRKWVSLPKTHAHTHMQTSEMALTCFALPCFVLFFSLKLILHHQLLFKSSPVSPRPLRHQHFWNFSTVCMVFFFFLHHSSEMDLLPVNSAPLTD